MIRDPRTIAAWVLLAPQVALLLGMLAVMVMRALE